MATYIIQKTSQPNPKSTDGEKDNYFWELAYGLKERSYPKADSDKDAVRMFREETKRVRSVPHRLIRLTPGLGYSTRQSILDSINCTDSKAQ
jgi:hypothetical protein